MDLVKPDVINVCITADICNAIFPEHHDKRRWDNIMCEAIRLKETTASIQDDFSTAPKITWFVRADPWMEKRFGSSTFLFERHGVHLSRLMASGDEVGWHPHLDTRNLKDEINKLPAIVSKVRQIFPVTSARIGEGFHSNEIMKLVNSLGFTADSTALPGRYSIESRTPFDWQGTSEKPYRPDLDNYRKENQKNGARILEIPFTMLPIKLPNDKTVSSSRYMNLSYVNERFREGVMGRNDWGPTIVAIAHPAELLPPRGYAEKHPLLSFNEDEPLYNLKFLFYRLRSLGYKIQYRCIREIPVLFDKDIAAKAYKDKIRDITSGRLAR